MSASAQNTDPKSSASAQLAAESRKIKDQIAKIGSGNDITIVRRDGQEFYGSILSINDESVVVREVDLKANVEINYQDIKKVSKGYGSAKAWNGKRIPPKKHKIGLIAGLAAIVVPVIIVLISLGNEK
jgi:hypothetical protein